MGLKAQEIRRLRGRLGLTQEQYARTLGVTWTTVSRWERGQARPDAKGPCPSPSPGGIPQRAGPGVADPETSWGESTQARGGIEERKVEVGVADLVPDGWKAHRPSSAGSRR
ncbi:MAG: helix-turn-helix domain-containing protein [Candidatus Rokubacteria bacterium]|nr:helix-turn-helix domain-containing protein [Candidatus Rokubacteria bacterium]